MLLHGHQLHRVVARRLYPRQHVVCGAAEPGQSGFTPGRRNWSVLGVLVCSQYGRLCTAPRRAACRRHLRTARAGGGMLQVLPLKYVNDATSSASDDMPTWAS